MDTQSFLQQASEYESVDDVRDSLHKLRYVESMTHPLAVVRVRAAQLQRWEASAEYRALLVGEYPLRDAEAPESDWKGVVRGIDGPIGEGAARGRRGRLGCRGQGEGQVLVVTNKLTQGEVVLWAGDSGPVPPADRRRILITQLAVILVAAGVLTVYAGWSLHWSTLRWFLIVLVVLAALRCVAYVVRKRESLTRGRYTVTNLRVYVDGQALGFPVRRSENLADLQPAMLWRNESVSFGDAARPSDAGRYGLVPIKRLVLYRIEQPQHVLELLRQVQPPMVG